MDADAGVAMAMGDAISRDAAATELSAWSVKREPQMHCTGTKRSSGLSFLHTHSSNDSHSRLMPPVNARL